jgi:hypothetical protein
MGKDLHSAFILPEIIFEKRVKGFALFCHTQLKRIIFIEFSIQKLLIFVSP